MLVILSGMIFFLFVPSKSDHWVSWVLIPLILASIGWRIVGWRKQEQEPTTHWTKSLKRINVPLLLVGVGLTIICVVYAYLIEKLGLPKENQTLMLIVMAVAMGLILLSGLRA